MNLVNFSQNFNHILYKYRLVNNMFSEENGYNIWRKRISISFSSDGQVVHGSAFAQSIVYQQNKPLLLTKMVIF